MNKNYRPLVSVVMAVFNGERTVSDAIESVLEQSFKDFEFVIVNDASTDGTDDILNTYAEKDSRIRIIKNEKNLKLASSLNVGIANAKGKYIVRMDADDVSLPQRIEAQVSFMEMHPDIDVLGAATRNKNKKGEIVSETKLVEFHEDIARTIYMRVAFLHPTVIMRKSFIDAMGGYNPRLCRCEDFDLWLRGYKKYRYHNLQECLLDYQLPLPSKKTFRNSYEFLKMLIVNGLKNKDRLKSIYAIIRYIVAFLLSGFKRSKYMDYSE